MRTIEIVGLPGSGKSYAKDFLMKSLRLKNISYSQLSFRMKRPQEKEKSGLIAKKINYLKYKLFRGQYMDLVAFLSDESSFSSQMIEAINQIGDIQLRKKQTRWLCELMCQNKILQRNQCQRGFFLIDEGFSHRALGLFSNVTSEVNVELLKRYLESLPKADVVLFTHVNSEVALEKLKERGLTQRLRGKDSSFIKKFYEQNIEVLNLVVDYYKENRPETIIEIQNQFVVKEFEDSLDFAIEKLTELPES